MAKAGFWTEEKIEILKKRALEGHTSSVIAKELGCSKNAVIGKRQRLGLARPTRSSTARKRNKMKKTQEKKNKRVEKYGKEGVLLKDLRPRSCRAPLWDDEEHPEEYHFCGDPVVDGNSYCKSCLPRMIIPKEQQHKRKRVIWNMPMMG